MLSVTGTILSWAWVMIVLWFGDIFPTRLILLQSVFKVVGGGDTVGVAVIYSIIADVVSEADRLVLP